MKVLVSVACLLPLVVTTVSPAANASGAGCAEMESVMSIMKTFQRARLVEGKDVNGQIHAFSFPDCPLWMFETLAEVECETSTAMAQQYRQAKVAELDAALEEIVGGTADCYTSSIEDVRGPNERLAKRRVIRLPGGEELRIKVVAEFDEGRVEPSYVSKLFLQFYDPAMADY